MAVPYAMSPQNSSRWKPPAAAVSWSPYVLQALYDPPGCLQICGPTEMPPHVCPPRISEDCLFLNVWTPRLSEISEPLPVMLFIHGGAFKTGYAGGIDGGIVYDATVLTNRTRAIVVAINYRLGSLGFLYAGGSTGIQGNVGLMDQEMAMAWVQANIAAFGGDPSRVMLFGQSAGAMSIASHLSRPASAGLYSAAVMESDPLGLPFRTPSAGLDLANVFAQAANCSNGSSTANWTAVEACLMALDADGLMAAQAAATSSVLASLSRLVDIFVPWTPVWNTSYLPQAPLAAFQSGQINDVPLVMGTVANEGNLFIYFASNKSMPDLEYFTFLEVMVGLTKGLELQGQYPVPSPAPTDLRPHLSDIATDLLFVCPNRNATASLAAAPGRKSPTWLYTYRHVQSFNPAIWGTGYPFVECWDFVCHSAELISIFYPYYPQYGTNYTAEETVLSQTTQGYWANLAANGAPGTGSAVSPLLWPPYNDSGRPTMMLQAAANAVLQDFNTANCDFIDQVIGYNFY